MNVMKFALTVGSIAALAACGGGGGGGGNQVPLRGVFIDAPVEGLSYSTPTQSGSTDVNGYFKYLDGEKVTFSLYGQELFGALGYSYLTPFDKLDNTINPGYSINLIRFLMALDADANRSNGIKIPRYSGVFDIDFNKSILDFQADADGKISAFLATNAGGRQLASVKDAVDHFNNSIANIAPAYTLSLVGKSSTSVIKNSRCTNGVNAGQIYEFGVQSVKLSGSDRLINPGDGNCTAGPVANEEVLYTTLNEGEFLSCAPTCSYKQLNRVAYLASDADGREAVEWSWHTPNSNVIFSVKSILSDPGSGNNPAALITFTEVMTLR